MKIRVVSFDYDGCLPIVDVCGTKYKDILVGNKILLDKLKRESAAYQKSYGFVGSNRQSFAVDFSNGISKLNGSCFPEIKRVCEYIGLEFDPFLLADIHDDLPDGESCRRAMDKDYQGHHANWDFDEYKATIIYTQIQRIANKHPDAEIEFDFFDDRQDILDSLTRFYRKHPYLIPKNVTLRLHQYEAAREGVDAGKQVVEIKGTGFIDANYKKTNQEMVRLVPARGPMINVGEDLDPALLTVRTPLGDSLPKTVPLEKPTKQPLPTQQLQGIKLSSGKVLTVAQAKKTITAYILETLKNRQIKTREEISSDELAGRDHPFVVGYFHKSKLAYVGDRFYSAYVDKQGQLNIAYKDATSGDWIPVIEDAHLANILGHEGLLNQILEASAKPQASLVGQSFLDPKLSPAQQQTKQLVAQFIRDQTIEHRLKTKTSGTHVDIPQGAFGNTTPFRAGKSYRSGTCYVSNNLISASFNNEGQLEFYRSKTGNGHDWGRISDVDALENYDLIKQLAASQRAKHQAIEEAERVEVCTIS
ncbi:hypothetical protein BN59_00885 [Legionella massiliensis]|uniref:Dot/Icm T4SS effector n=1 Tax=Legionella massiliensis TaxID=1034943 RepID=A0A078KU98_9GAMM|nr:hypothetical protein [Legionella massiliensis]CDZ76611.1 hypothetical protein BN59_00885 [Legionella massiliensis]CEE12349.1 hypothetical protein BN1094_00885 [Legionella massiliensis]